MRKLIAKLPSHLLTEEDTKRDISFLSAFAEHAANSSQFSSPEAHTVKEYQDQLAAEYRRSVYINSIQPGRDICCRINRNADSRYTESTIFFSYHEPAKSIHTSRNRFTTIKSKTFT